MPFQMTAMFSAQNAKKQIQMPLGCGPYDFQHGVDGRAADPRLDAEPAAGDQRAQDGGNVGAAHAKRRAHENRKRDAIFCACVRVEKHGDEDDQVAQQDGADGLLPIHAAGDEAGRQHVSGDADRHGDPEAGVVVSAPGAPVQGDRRKVRVIE